MARFDELPADQKAVLQLLLRQGKGYDDIARLLKISAEAVRDRALTALDSLGPDDAGDLAAETQDQIGDYLLGQQTTGEADGTRALLELSPAGRAWGRVVGGELRGAGLVENGALPTIPEGGSDAAEAFGATAPRRRPAAGTAGAASGGAARTDRPIAERVSRRGGLILLGVLALVVAGVLALALGAFSGGDDKSSTKASSTTPTSTSTTAGTQVEAQVNLKPPSGSSKALGVANVVSQGGQRALAVIGQDLAASGHYVLWLRNGTKVKFLGFFPPVTGKGTNKGRLQGLVAAPGDLAQYKEVLVSREAGTSPKQPTDVVLQGALSG
jgi:hypothetical protein